jgi:hypothetical protein
LDHGIASRRSARLLASRLVVLFAVLFAGRARAQEPVEVPEIGLTFEFPKVPRFEERKSEYERKIRRFVGDVDDKKFEVSIWLRPKEEYDFQLPEDYVDEKERYSARKDSHVTIHYEKRETIERAFGVLPYAVIATGKIEGNGADAVHESIFTLAFVSEKGAATIDVIVNPTATPAEIASIKDALAHSVTVSGTPIDPRWTDAEAKARWEKDVPPKARKDEMKPPQRTAHYIVLTNSASGALFGKKMEENYAKVQAIYPFKDRKFQRLLPIFLFRSKEQYDEFCLVHAKWFAGVSAGHARDDYYATSYESPNDPTHLHEATHQIMFNRIGLWGGGSWFQEGLAEFTSSSRDDRGTVARQVAKGATMKLKEIMKLDQLIGGGFDAKTGGSRTHELYLESALLIEFLRESPQTKARFPDLLDEVGSIPRSSLKNGNLIPIEKALKSTADGSIDDLEKAFTQYCVKR